MHGQQCQSCGAYDDSSTRSVNPCEHCPTPLCQSCKRNHGPLCKELQARKLRGEGPTIGNVPMFAHRHGHETPPTTGPDRPASMPAVLGAPYDLSAPTVIQTIVDKGMLELFQGFKDLIDGTYGSVDKLDVESIDRQLDAVKSLLKGEGDE